MKRYNEVEIDYETKEAEDALIALNLKELEEREAEEEYQK